MVGKKTGPYGDKLRENRGSLIKTANCTPTHRDTGSNIGKPIHTCTSLAIMRVYMHVCVYNHNYTKEQSHAVSIHMLGYLSVSICANVYAQNDRRGQCESGGMPCCVQIRFSSHRFWCVTFLMPVRKVFCLLRYFTSSNPPNALSSTQWNDLAYAAMFL